MNPKKGTTMEPVGRRYPCSILAAGSALVLSYAYRLSGLGCRVQACKAVDLEVSGEWLIVEVPSGLRV